MTMSTRDLSRLRRFRCLVLCSLVCASQAGAQSASLSGLVLRDSTERPIPGAQIEISQLKLRTRTDSAGKFYIGGIGRGTFQVDVKFVGYQPSSTRITFESSAIEADFLLVPTVTKLEEVEVVDEVGAVAKRFAIKLAEFEERRAAGIGRYLTADQFANEQGRSASSIIAARIAGFRIMRAQGRSWLASGRDQSGRSPSRSEGIPVPQGCYVQIILNGRIEYGGQSGQNLFDIDALNSLDIIGMEFYSLANTPSRFKNTGASQCGTVIIWTKGG